MFSLNNFKEFIYSIERSLPIKPYTVFEPLVEETSESIFETLTHKDKEKDKDKQKNIIQSNLEQY